MRWLIQDPELSRIGSLIKSKEIGPGERAVIEVQSLNEAYRLSGGAEVMLKVSPLDAASSLSSLSPETGKTGEDGKWTFKTQFERPGAYRVEVQGEKEEAFIGRDDAILIVQGARKESLYSEPQPELLKALSEVSTGTAQSTRLSEDLRFVDQKKYRIVQQKSLPIWNRYVGLVLILFGIAGKNGGGAVTQSFARTPITSMTKHAPWSRLTALMRLAPVAIQRTCLIMKVSIEAPISRIGS